MSSELARLQRVWETLGAEDPLWAVASLPEKRGGRWNVRDFFATGEAEVSRFQDILRSVPGARDRFRHVLDFGCGVGRLSLAWLAHADAVTGVDISAPMLDQARRLTRDVRGLTFQLNTANDLGALPAGAFDLAFSHICLQHMPWPMARGYLREFQRLTCPGGWVMFQLPSRLQAADRGARLRRRLVDSLPFGLGRAYRQWRHGSSAVFDMHFTPRETVMEALSSLGMQVLQTAPDASAGAHTEGFIYVCRNPGAA